MSHLIESKLGRLFKITTNFSDAPVMEYDGVSSLVKTFPFAIDKFVEGQIHIFRDHDAGLSLDIPIRTPTPIEVVAIVNNEKPRFTDDTVPVFVRVDIYGQDDNVLSTLNVGMKYTGDSVMYFDSVGSLDVIDIGESGRIPVAKFDSWIDVETRERVEVYFPQRDAVFQDLEFVIEQSTLPL